MSDNKKKQDWRDDIRINTEEDYEIAYAARSMHCTRKKVIQAIKQVGNLRKDVAAWVKSNPDKTTTD